MKEDTIVKKKIFLLLISFVMAMFIAGCSSNEADEIVHVHNDFNQHISDPMKKLTADLEERAMAVESGEIEREEFLSYLEDEVKPTLNNMKTYTDGYGSPSSDEAKRYYDKLSDTLDFSIEGIKLSGDLTAGAIDGSISKKEYFKKNEKFKEMGKEMDKKVEELANIRNKYEKKYDIEFEDMGLD